MSTCRKVIDGLIRSGAGEVMVIVGGTILDQDVPALKEMGVAQVFVPGAPLEAGLDFLREKFGPERVGGPGPG